MITYYKAKEEIKKMQKYVDVIESFEVLSLEDLIIYQYTMFNSISKVIKSLNNNNVKINFDINDVTITHEFVRNTILDKPKNELHEYVRRHYLIKTRPQRRLR